MCGAARRAQIARAREKGIIATRLDCTSPTQRAYFVERLSQLNLVRKALLRVAVNEGNTVNALWLSRFFEVQATASAAAAAAASATAQARAQPPPRDRGPSAQAAGGPGGDAHAGPAPVGRPERPNDDSRGCGAGVNAVSLGYRLARRVVPLEDGIARIINSNRNSNRNSNSNSNSNDGGSDSALRAGSAADSGGDDGVFCEATLLDELISEGGAAAVDLSSSWKEAWMAVAAALISSSPPPPPPLPPGAELRAMPFAMCRNEMQANGSEAALTDPARIPAVVRSRAGTVVTTTVTDTVTDGGDGGTTTTVDSLAKTLSAWSSRMARHPESRREQPTELSAATPAAAERGGRSQGARPPRPKHRSGLAALGAWYAAKENKSLSELLRKHAARFPERSAVEFFQGRPLHMPSAESACGWGTTVAAPSGVVPVASDVAASSQGSIDGGIAAGAGGGDGASGDGGGDGDPRSVAAAGTGSPTAAAAPTSHAAGASHGHPAGGAVHHAAAHDTYDPLLRSHSVRVQWCVRPNPRYWRNRAHAPQPSAAPLAHDDAAAVAGAFDELVGGLCLAGGATMGTGTGVMGTGAGVVSIVDGSGRVVECVVGTSRGGSYEGSGGGGLSSGAGGLSSMSGAGRSHLRVRFAEGPDRWGLGLCAATALSLDDAADAATAGDAAASNAAGGDDDDDDAALVARSRQAQARCGDTTPSSSSRRWLRCGRRVPPAARDRGFAFGFTEGLTRGIVSAVGSTGVAGATLRALGAHAGPFQVKHLSKVVQELAKVTFKCDRACQGSAISRQTRIDSDRDGGTSILKDCLPSRPFTTDRE